MPSLGGRIRNCSVSGCRLFLLGSTVDTVETSAGDFRRFQVFNVKVDLGSWDVPRPCPASGRCLRSTRNFTFLATGHSWFVCGYKFIRQFTELLDSISHISCVSVDLARLLRSISLLLASPKECKKLSSCWRNTASVVLTPRVSETASPSRASAADNLADYAWVAKEHFSARAPTVESDWFADRARAAKETLQLIPNQQTTEAVVEKTNVTSDK